MGVEWAQHLLQVTCGNEHSLDSQQIQMPTTIPNPHQSWNPSTGSMLILLLEASGTKQTKSVHK